MLANIVLSVMTSLPLLVISVLMFYNPSFTKLAKEIFVNQKNLIVNLKFSKFELLINIEMHNSRIWINLIKDMILIF